MKWSKRLSSWSKKKATLVNMATNRWPLPPLRSPHTWPHKGGSGQWRGRFLGPNMTSLSQCNFTSHPDNSSMLVVSSACWNTDYIVFTSVVYRTFNKPTSNTSTKLFPLHKEDSTLYERRTGVLEGTTCLLRATSWLDILGQQAGLTPARTPLVRRVGIWMPQVVTCRLPLTTIDMGAGPSRPWSRGNSLILPDSREEETTDLQDDPSSREGLSSRVIPSSKEDMTIPRDARDSHLSSPLGCRLVKIWARI